MRPAITFLNIQLSNSRVGFQYLKLINCAKTGGCQCIGIFRCIIECVCDKMCLCVITSCCFVEKCIKYICVRF